MPGICRQGAIPAAGKHSAFSSRTCPKHSSLTQMTVLIGHPVFDTPQREGHGHEPAFVPEGGRADNQSGLKDIAVLEKEKSDG
jgi:hypothetical protein